MVSDLLIVGASSGLGHAMSCLIANKFRSTVLVSRSRPPSLGLSDGASREWIQCDVSKSSEIDNLASQLKDRSIRSIVFTAGTWESDRDIRNVGSSEIFDIISTNTSSFVALTTRLLDTLGQQCRCNVFVVASTAALENATGPRAAYAASKFGIRGAVHALREITRKSRVYVTCLSVGGLASDLDPFLSIEETLKQTDFQRIPSADISRIILAVLDQSDASVVKEVVMPAFGDTNA